MVRTFFRLLRTISYLKFRQIYWLAYRRCVPYARVRRAPVVQVINHARIFDGIPWLAETQLESGEFHLFGDLLPAHEAGVFAKQERRYMLPYTLNYLDFLHAANSDSVPFIELVGAYKVWREHAKVDIKSAWHPYQASRRLASLVFFHSKFGQRFDESTFAAVSSDLSTHYQFLRKNLEFNIDANHLLTNYWSLALFELYADYPDKIFLERYINELSGSFINGVYFERSISYHTMVLWQLAVIHRLCEYKHREGAQKIERLCSLQKIGSNSQLLCQGELFRFGDVVLSAAPDLASLYHYLREKSLGVSDEVGYPSTIAGFEVISKGKFTASIDAGVPSPAFQPGHAHDSTLGVVVSIAGVTVLGSMPVSTYDNSRKRKVERSARWYSKPVIRGAANQEVWASFRVGRRTQPVVKSLGHRCELECKYYLVSDFCAKPVIVRREVDISENLRISDYFPVSLRYTKDCYSQFLIPLPPSASYEILDSGIEVDYGVALRVLYRIKRGELLYLKAIRLSLDLEQKAESHFLKVRVGPQLVDTKNQGVCVELEER